MAGVSRSSVGSSPFARECKAQIPVNLEAPHCSPIFCVRVLDYKIGEQRSFPIVHWALLVDATISAAHWYCDAVPARIQTEEDMSFLNSFFFLAIDVGPGGRAIDGTQINYLREK